MDRKEYLAKMKSLGTKKLSTDPPKKKKKKKESILKKALRKRKEKRAYKKKLDSIRGQKRREFDGRWN